MRVVISWVAVEGNRKYCITQQRDFESNQAEWRKKIHNVVYHNVVDLAETKKKKQRKNIYIYEME